MNTYQKGVFLYKANLFFLVLFLFSNFELFCGNTLYAYDNPSNSFQKNKQTSYFNSNDNLQEIEYYPKEYENQEYINFSKCKIYKLNQDAINYANANKKNLHRTVTNIYSSCRTVYHISKDCPELSELTKNYLNELNDIFGPAIIQYLSLIKDSEDYEKLNPNYLFETSNNSIKKMAEKHSVFKDNFPFIFGERYEVSKAEELLKSYILDYNFCHDIFSLYLLELHPSVLSVDADYIITKLSNKRHFKLAFENSNITWNHILPKYFGLIKSEINTDEIFISFDTVIDGLKGSYQIYPIYEDITKISTKEYLEKLSKNEDYLTMLINGKQSDNTKISINEIGDKIVLAIENKEKNADYYNLLQTYTFIAGKFTFEYKFTIKAINEADIDKLQQRYKPLFERLVKESSVDIN